MSDTRWIRVTIDLEEPVQSGPREPGPPRYAPASVEEVEAWAKDVVEANSKLYFVGAELTFQPRSVYWKAEEYEAPET